MLTVYVPVAGSRAADAIDPGAAIVGSPAPGDQIRLDFEGGRRSRDDYVRRLASAGARHLARTPSISRVYASPSEVVAVGYWEPASGLDVFEPTLLRLWAPDALRSQSSPAA